MAYLDDIAITLGACAPKSDAGPDAVGDTAPTGPFTVPYLQGWESGAADWKDRSGSAPILVTDGTSPSGSKVQMLNRAASGGDYFSGSISVVAGQSYCVSELVKWVGGGAPFLGIQRFDGNGSDIGFNWLIGAPYTDALGPVTQVSSTDPGWQTVSRTFSMPANTAEIRLSTELWNGASKGGSDLAYLDDIAITLGACGAITHDAGPDGPGTTGHTRYLSVLAHPDDAIIFFNPDMEAFVRAGAESRLVHVTSGNASESRGWAARELGILDGYSAMANQASNCQGVAMDPPVPCLWTCAPATYAGKPVSKCTSTNPLLSVTFVRLWDGLVGNLWGDPIPVSGDNINELTQVAPDGGTPATFTRQDLIDVLAAITVEFAPNHILTMDSTISYNGGLGNQAYDHGDHIGSGFFALAAAQTYHAYDDIRIYRGYTAVEESPNVTPTDFAEKQRLMNVYAPIGSPDCTNVYPNYCNREISYASFFRTGAIQSGGFCLDHVGANVVVSTCSGAATQTWNLAADASLRANNGQCLTAGNLDAALTLAACADDLKQRWAWFALPNGQLRGVDGSCLNRQELQEVTVTITACDRNDNANVPARQSWAPQ